MESVVTRTPLIDFLYREISHVRRDLRESSEYSFLMYLTRADERFIFLEEDFSSRYCGALDAPHALLLYLDDLYNAREGRGVQAEGQQIFHSFVSSQIP